MDLDNTEERLAELRRALPDERVFGISSYSGTGLNELVEAFGEMVLSAERTAGEAG
jgi:hypothetical protein